MSWSDGAVVVNEMIVGRQLESQGLRPTSSGGHYAIEVASRAQFSRPPLREAFRPFSRLRRTRNETEYDAISRIDADSVRHDHRLAVGIQQAAERLVDNLPVYVP